MESPDRGEIGDRDETTNREDIPLNEVIEVQEISGETIHSCDMFAFCMDQIMNASTGEERQEARDLLVDNFGEISLHEFDLLDVILDKGKQSRVDPELPSTSQASSSQVSHNPIQTRPKTPQKQLDYFRKYWRQVKSNPAKHQKALKRMQNYHKQRLEQMSPEQKKAYLKRHLEADRKYRHKLSAEKKLSINRKTYHQRKLNTLNKFVCKIDGCGKSFVQSAALANHERIHLGIKPYSCSWPNCQHSSAQRSNIIQHVRTKHFKLPRAKQQRLNIIDTLNPNEYVRVNDELAKRRLE